MLSTNNLEKVIELEAKLRAEYQAQLDAKTAEIDAAKQKIDAQQVTIEKQLEQIKELSPRAQENKRLEQLNRELTSRSESLQEEVTSQKSRVKTMQKELAEARAEVKQLKILDAAALKKNLVANKKKLAEKAKANELLQKAANTHRSENLTLQRKVEELEAQLAETAGEPENDAAAA